MRAYLGSYIAILEQKWLQSVISSRRFGQVSNTIFRTAKDQTIRANPLTYSDAR